MDKRALWHFGRGKNQGKKKETETITCIRHHHKKKRILLMKTNTGHKKSDSTKSIFKLENTFVVPCRLRVSRHKIQDFGRASTTGSQLPAKRRCFDGLIPRNVALREPAGLRSSGGPCRGLGIAWGAQRSPAGGLLQSLLHIQELPAVKIDGCCPTADTITKKNTQDTSSQRVGRRLSS